MTETFRFCPRCGRALVDRPGRNGRPPRRACGDTACRYVQRRNPTPVVAALVEHDGDLILARNAAWPDGWFALISGFLESGEDPVAAVAREVKEELDLDVTATSPIGNYLFEPRNEVMLCYHAIAQGTIRLGEELCDVRRYRPDELRPWPRATGLAVADWLKARGLPVEFVDFPGAADKLRELDGA
jgi:NADH pyrophosphatase NudC (nudix superfamily)